MIIDITNEIISNLKSKLIGVEVLSYYQNITSSFPTIVVEEIDNSAYINSKDSAGFQHSNIAFSIEIYTIGNTKISKAKQIRDEIDVVMSGEYGMTRGQPIVIPNYLDNNVHRYKLTYTALIDKNKKIYRG